MKNKISIVFVVFFLLHQSNAEASTAVYDQLCEVNKEWLKNKIDLPVLNETILLTTEDELISLHLNLVENSLRGKDVSHLTLDQQEKRIQSLDVLRAYWKRGKFPINLYHAERTPYFIDHNGTACAVGQMVIESGYGDFAKQIQGENNYDYIFELDKQYAALSKWAFEHGFTMNELAWIQPTYGTCWSTGAGYVYNPTCYGFNDGYIYLEAPTASTAPFTVAGPPCWGLFAGTYTYTITDAIGIEYVQSYTLVNPAPIGAVANWVSDASSLSSCDGELSASNFGGVGVLNYFWFNSSEVLVGNSQSINTLCPDDYKVVINDVNGCGEVSQWVTINYLAEIADNSETILYSIFPNPTSENLTIKLAKVNENSSIELTDIFGRIILMIKAKKNNLIDLHDLNLESGCYFVRIENNGNSYTEKIVFLR